MAETEKSMSEKKDNGKSPTVPVSTLAKLFNLTSVRVQQLAADGIISKSGRGQYDLWSSVRGYIKYLQERKVNQWDADDDNPSDIKKEQLRRTKEEADKLELQNARTRGELVEVEKVKRAGEKVMSAIRNRILNMPLTDDEKDQCLRNLLSLRDIDFSG
jgi:phage terminase Nu1 subunit (DNA packaging protein)